MSVPPSRPMTAAEWGLLLALSVLWGGSFLFVGVAVRDLPPFTIIAARVGLAALALHLVLAATGRRIPAGPRVWAAFLGMGLLNNVVPFSLIVWGQTHIASGLASILNATTPLFGVVVAHHLARDEPMTGRRLAGVGVGFAGVAVMVGGAALGDLGVHVAAQVAVLGAALSYAFAGVYGRRFQAMGVEPLATAAGQVTASSLVMIPLMLAVDRPWTLPPPGPETWLALIGLALLATALAYVVFFRVLATAGAVNILLVTLLIPVSAILLGALVLDEALEGKHLLGMGMIGAGLALIDGRPLAALRRLARPARA